MATLFIVLPLALLVSALAVLAFVWSVRRGQLDDLTTPALRVLAEDEKLENKVTRPMTVLPPPPDQQESPSSPSDS